MVDHCPWCGSLTDKPILFTKRRQVIFCYVWDNPGCTTLDIKADIYNGMMRQRNTVNVHLSRIRDALMRTQYRLVRYPADQIVDIVKHRKRGAQYRYKIINKPKVSVEGTENALA